MGNKNSALHHEIHIEDHTHTTDTIIKHKYDKCIYNAQNEENVDDAKKMCEVEKMDAEDIDWSNKKAILKRNHIYNCIDNKFQEEKKLPTCSKEKSKNCIKDNSNTYSDYKEYIEKEKRLKELRKCNNFIDEKDCKEIENYEIYKDECIEYCDNNIDICKKNNLKKSSKKDLNFLEFMPKKLFPLIYWLFVFFTIVLFILIIAKIYKLIMFFCNVFRIFIWHIYKKHDDKYADSDGAYVYTKRNLLLFEGNVIDYIVYLLRDVTFLWTLIIWFVLFAFVLTFWFIKRVAGWPPASIVWKAIGLFEGSKTTFRWLDSLVGCSNESKKPMICNSQVMWNLIEDWTVETYQAVDPEFNEKEKEKKFREALNKIKTIDKTYEEFTVENDIYKNYKPKTELIENFFSFNKIKKNFNDIGIKFNKKNLENKKNGEEQEEREKERDRREKREERINE